MRAAPFLSRLTVLSRLPNRCCQTSQTGSPKEDKYEMFRKLNEYASSGLWDDRYNKPRLFLSSKNRQKAYELHDKMTPKTDPFFQRSPYGVHLEVMYRLSLGIAAITIICSLYVMLIPEEKRLKYKYRKEHHASGGEHD
ncbi:hypothetical protein WUBG_03025 [Wuchereria bancrofti]|uniref:Uncharacterized protein n=1 Tax=Wuchereria bancrofti TaxID=6293 RepID=J9F972_WUCBA|nr:hypothetical protein WUBG_03025 [Wuchereria bancrofti]VDM19960.1 unnamed protein product [Wuchereria bancrofti]